VIRATRLVEHRFSLEPPLRSAAGTWHERRSLLLVLEDADGHFGLGEAAPLPGFSADGFETARAALLSLLGRPLPDRVSTPNARTALAAAGAKLGSPAARSAIEAALLDLRSRREERPAWSLLVPDATLAREVPLSLWLPDGVEPALESAKLAAERGIGAFKVKLDARRDLEDGIRTLESLRRTLGPALALRADANRSALRSELAPYVERLRALELEWLEEPTAAPLGEPLGVPIALDESLEPSGAPPELAQRPFIAALVLKPTALGGVSRCLELAEHARAEGRASVASHTLEGPTGFMAAAALALALGPERAHGLAPHRALHGDRPPALAVDRDAVVAWNEAGFGLSADRALAGAEIVREHRA
jgi:O-succinylbenzoate synthase